MPLTKKAKDTAGKWYEAKQQLDHWKAEELSLRNETISLSFPKGLEKGLQKQDLDNGFVMKATGTVNYKIDEAAIGHVVKSIKERFKVDVSNCIRIKYELAEGAYNQLPDEIRKMLDEAITAKPGTPSLEIMKPKR